MVRAAVGGPVTAWLPDNGYGTSAEIHEAQIQDPLPTKQIRQRQAD